MRNVEIRTTVAVFDAHGTVVSGNEAYPAFLNRKPVDVCGLNWRDWTPAAQLGIAEAMFQRCLSGEPIEFVREIVRPDGTIAIGRSQLTTIQRPSGILVLGTMQAVRRSTAVEAFKVAEYVAGLSSEMAQTAADGGFKALTGALKETVAEAGRIADLLRDIVAVRH